VATHRDISLLDRDVSSYPHRFWEVARGRIISPRSGHARQRATPL